MTPDRDDGDEDHRNWDEHEPTSSSMSREDRLPSERRSYANHRAGHLQRVRTPE